MVRKSIREERRLTSSTILQSRKRSFAKLLGRRQLLVIIHVINKLIVCVIHINLVYIYLYSVHDMYLVPGTGTVLVYMSNIKKYIMYYQYWYSVDCTWPGRPYSIYIIYNTGTSISIYKKI